MHFAEGSEVMCAEKQLCGVVHRLIVQAMRNACDKVLPERVFACCDSVLICALESRESRVQLFIDGEDTLYGNVRRQERIEGVCKGLKV